MKHNLLARYERDDTGRIIIDVSATRLEDLYNDFDKKAPFIRRDLDQNLVDYLIECAEEIGRVPFVIRFNLEQTPERDQLNRVRQSIEGYFAHLGNVERYRVRRMFRTSLLLTGAGIALFMVAIGVGEFLGESRSVAENVLAEGLTVAAWVALWEALAKFIIEWPACRSSIRRFARLSRVPLSFRSGTSGDSDAEPAPPG